MALNPKVLQTGAAMMKASQALLQTNGVRIRANAPRLTRSEKRAMEREILAALALDTDDDSLGGSSARLMLDALSGE